MRAHGIKRLQDCGYKVNTAFKLMTIPKKNRTMRRVFHLQKRSTGLRFFHMKSLFNTPAKILIPLLVAALLAFLFLNLNDKKPAPNLSFTTIEGKEISMASLKGKIVIVNFWATYCPGCIEEMPDLVSTYKQYHEKGLEIIAVSIADDPPNQVLNFAQKNALPFPVAHDSDAKISKAFDNVSLTPTSFIIDQQGRVIGKTIGKLDFVSLNKLLAQSLLMKESK
jgi:peroxiredoxin